MYDHWKNLSEVQKSDEQRKRQWALKLLTENMSNGILSLTEKTLKMLKQKHPEVNETAGLLQVCGEWVVRYEAAIHAMHDIFNDNNTEGILLMDRPFIYSIERLCFTTWNSYAQSTLHIYRTVTYVPLDCLSSVEQNYYLKGIQYKVIQHRWVLLLTGYYHCFNFCSISFPSTNSTLKRLLM